jgi:prolyl-tRNA synthetase
MSYRKMMLAYMRTFQRMGLKAIPMVADTGPIGGDLSHEFIILAETGESQVYYDAAFEEIDYQGGGFSHESAEDLARFYALMTTPYAATDEKHDPAAWEKVAPARRREGRGIEVGHIFYFGTKYSKAMGFSITAQDGKPLIPEMGSYGIGVSRLVGAIIEASHDEAGIIWPDAVAPFRAAILNLRAGDGASTRLCDELYARLKGEALYDDRDARAGEKFADADLMGLPWQLIVGPRGAANGVVELKRRASGERQEVSLESALARIL